MRVNLSGTLDTEFGSGGIQTTDIGTNARASSVVIQTDGKIILAGSSFNLNGGNYDLTTVRYNTDGLLENVLWDAGGIAVTDFGATNDFANDIVLDADGKAIVAGQNDNKIALARYQTILPPTAAYVSIGGRVRTKGGAGIRNAVVGVDRRQSDRAALCYNRQFRSLPICRCSCRRNIFLDGAFKTLYFRAADYGRQSDGRIDGHEFCRLLT